jgi:hypothetical protein
MLDNEPNDSTTDPTIEPPSNASDASDASAAAPPPSRLAAGRPTGRGTGRGRG